MKTFEYFTQADVALFDKLEKFSLTGGILPPEFPLPSSAKETVLRIPDEKYSFLHEAVIYSFQGVLFAAWYACPKTELHGEAAIQFRVSKDGGKTWEEEKTLITDKTGAILYCPPVFGEEDGKLYMLVNEMVSADHMHALDWFVWDESAQNFSLVKSLPLPFKLNTNVVKLSNGNLFLPGRVAELDCFPKTPAALLSENGILGDWKVYNMQENGLLPDGASLVHPECSSMEDGEKIFIFCRNDERNVPLGYLSENGGKAWQGPFAIDLPFSSSKIYSGRLSDGRYYVVGNVLSEKPIEWGVNRIKLVLYVSKPNEWTFDKCYVLFDYENKNAPDAHAWHYPATCEQDGKLYIIYSVNYFHQKDSKRGGSVLEIPICDL